MSKEDIDKAKEGLSDAEVEGRDILELERE